MTMDQNTMITQEVTYFTPGRESQLKYLEPIYFAL
jgi:hypothetical protein